MSRVRKELVVCPVCVGRGIVRIGYWNLSLTLAVDHENHYNGVLLRCPLCYKRKEVDPALAATFLLRWSLVEGDGVHADYAVLTQIRIDFNKGRC